jgi:hypothetical protein
MATKKFTEDANGLVDMAWDPITRIVGSLGIYTKIDFGKGKVADCHSTSSIFRGYSIFMKGKDPRDAHFITSRICEICGDNHATCSCYAQNMAYGVRPPALGEQIVNLGEAAEYMFDHKIFQENLVGVDHSGGGASRRIQPVSPTDYPIVYYVNPKIVAANHSAERTVDPAAVDGLIYATAPLREQVLAAALYLLPETLAEESANALRLARPVAPTHRFSVYPRRDRRPSLLRSRYSRRVRQVQRPGPIPYMSMVWQVSVDGGPLAVQPPDIQIVEAAMMRTSVGPGPAQHEARSGCGTPFPIR